MSRRGDDPPASGRRRRADGARGSLLRAADGRVALHRRRPAPLAVRPAAKAGDGEDGGGAHHVRHRAEAVPRAGAAPRRRPRRLRQPPDEGVRRRARGRPLRRHPPADDGGDPRRHQVPEGQPQHARAEVLRCEGMGGDWGGG